MAPQHYHDNHDHNYTGSPDRHEDSTADEERPLLQHSPSSQRSHSPERRPSTYSVHNYEVKFAEDDISNPRLWPRRKKLLQVFIIALMAILSPLGSNMFNPGIKQIADDFGTDETKVIATTTGYVIMLGLGPLVLAPFSETFGRRRVYIVCFGIFGLLQVPTAMAPTVEWLIFLRTIAGAFGSVGIANGGGTLSDMYKPSERAKVFGWYLLGPLLGPTLGPLFGGIIVTHLTWRWVYWCLAIVAISNTTAGFFFLQETYVPVLLGRRKHQLEKEEVESKGSVQTNFYYQGEDTRPLLTKLKHSIRRPLVIFIQPIVLTMSFYQAIIFGTTYSIYTNMQKIFSAEPYNMNSEQVGLLFLGPGFGFLTAVLLIIPRIDTIYNRLTERNHGQEKPEYRLPLANIGAVLLPASLFAFGWTVEYRVHWIAPVIAAYFYGIGQVIIFNTVQNYYIDSFAKYAASAIAGGSVFRSLVGGVVPLVAPMLFNKVGYGWGISVFAFLCVLVAPTPILFYIYGERIRARFQIKF